MKTSVSPKDEIWFLRVCHYISNAVSLPIHASERSPSLTSYSKSFQLHAFGHLCFRGDFYLFNTGHSLHEYPFLVSAPRSIWANKTEGQNTFGWVVPTKSNVKSFLLHHRTKRTSNQRRRNLAEQCSRNHSAAHSLN